VADNHLVGKESAFLPCKLPQTYQKLAKAGKLNVSASLLSFIFNFAEYFCLFLNDKFLGKSPHNNFQFEHSCLANTLISD
jgi:hypothetical protein